MKEITVKKIFYISHLRSLILDELKRSIFLKLTTKAAPVFVKGGDIISINTQIFGLHEPVITAIISSCAKSGYCDFLLDIGANIGLTTCQNGNEFAQVHMFEPNPICQHVLAANTAIALKNPNAVIHKYALGSQETVAQLMVPRNNWGGGYIANENNAYSKKTLAAKDGFKEFNSENYLKFDIEIRDTATELTPIFKGLKDKNLQKGVIKIDVEGYEPNIIRGISQSLPLQMECYIIFESFNNTIDIDSILKQFNGRASVYKISGIKPWKQQWPKWVKLLWAIFDDTISWQLRDNISGNWRGDIVLHIRSN